MIKIYKRKEDGSPDLSTEMKMTNEPIPVDFKLRFNKKDPDGYLVVLIPYRILHFYGAWYTTQTVEYEDVTEKFLIHED